MDVNLELFKIYYQVLELKLNWEDKSSIFFVNEKAQTGPVVPTVLSAFVDEEKSSIR